MIIESLQALITRTCESTHYNIRPLDITKIWCNRSGWIVYEFKDGYGGIEERFVAPHFDMELALQHELGDGHPWKGEWLLGGKTLHCVTCGIDGT